MIIEPTGRTGKEAIEKSVSVNARCQGKGGENPNRGAKASQKLVLNSKTNFCLGGRTGIGSSSLHQVQARKTQGGLAAYGQESLVGTVAVGGEREREGRKDKGWGPQFPGSCCGRGEDVLHQ